MEKRVHFGKADKELKMGRLDAYIHTEYKASSNFFKSTGRNKFTCTWFPEMKEIRSLW